MNKNILTLLGLQHYKKLVSYSQTCNMRSKVSAVNNKLHKAGEAKVYFINFRRQNQADLYLWEVVEYEGYLNVQAKTEREKFKRLQ